MTRALGGQSPYCKTAIGRRAHASLPLTVHKQMKAAPARVECPEISRYSISNDRSISAPAKPSSDVSGCMLDCRSPINPACTPDFDPWRHSLHEKIICHDPMIENETMPSGPSGGIADYPQLAVSVTHEWPLVVLHRTQYTSTSSLDPLVDAFSHSLVSYVGYTWHDPIVVNETAGWISLVDKPVLHPLRGEGFNATDSSPTTLVSSSKKPRGRPKKKTKMHTKHKSCEPRSPHVQNSYLEAENTWNTAKLLGISSTEERVVLSGLRKSKRLMIMEELTV